MISIPLSQLPIILFCFYIIFIGLNSFAEPIAKLIRRKGFDFVDAMADTVVGLFFIVIGLIALVIALPK